MIYPHAIMTAMNPRDERRSRAPGRVLVGLFIGLGLVGLLALWTGIRMLIDPPDEPKAAIGPLMIGAILTGIGVIMPFVLSGARRRGAVRAARAKQRPGEPWTWREDWASGRITGTTGSVARALWLFVLVWNGFTWPVAWLFLREKSQEPGIYFVLSSPPSACCCCSSRFAESSSSVSTARRPSCCDESRRDRTHARG